MHRNLAAILLAVAVAVAVIASPLARAQDAVSGVTDLATLRTAVQADKKAFVAATLQLSDAEAKKFWPIYADYQRDLEAANRKRTRALEGVIALDKPMSEPFARNLGKDLLAADEDELRARRAAQTRVLKVLPAPKAVRYLQLESKIRAVQAYDVAMAFPLAK